VAPDPDHRHLALFTGTIGRANNCEQILDAARVLRDRSRQDVRIVLIGDGSERPRLEAEARRDDLTNVEFLDPVPKTELVEWVRWATCLLLVLRPIPVFDTSSPNKLFDAFAAGRPIVQTTQGWIHRLVRDKECGLNVRPGDPEEMASAVERLCDDPALNERLSRNALALASRYALSRLSADMRRVLQEVAASHE
jgi:glycosyltransferase involved in cell wall biosynthesis